MKKNYLGGVLAFLLLLTACGTETADIPFPLTHDTDDLTLTLGMTQEEVESHTPWTSTQTESDSVTLVTYLMGQDSEDTQAVTAAYRNGKAVYFSAGTPLGDTNAAIPWSLQGITIGSTQADVDAAFGYPTRGEPTNRSPDIPENLEAVEYDYLSDGTLLAADTGDHSYSVFFFLLDGKVTYLSLYLRGCGPYFEWPAEGDGTTLTVQVND